MQLRSNKFLVYYDNKLHQLSFRPLRSLDSLKEGEGICMSMSISIHPILDRLLDLTYMFQQP